MESKIRIGGHPIHPMLVTLPIGLIIWTLAADLVFFATKDVTWYNISFWTDWAALATTVLAAVPGFADYLIYPLRGHIRTKATTHMLFNLLAAAFLFAAGLLMINRNATTGFFQTLVIALQAGTVGAVAISGWLGGELVYRHQLGVMHEVQPVDAEPAREEMHIPRR